MVKDIKGFVAQFGWELIGNATTTYKLKKDGVFLTYSRRGRGDLHVRLLGMVTEEVATSVTKLQIRGCTREEYLADILPKMTQAKAIETIRSRLDYAIESAKHAVRHREIDLYDFDE